MLAFWIFGVSLCSSEGSLTRRWPFLRQVVSLQVSQRTLTSPIVPIKCMAVWSSGMILASGARGPGFNSRSSPFGVQALQTCKTTARGFEPLRAEPNGCRIHLLSRSDTLSWSKDSAFRMQASMKQCRTRDTNLKKAHLIIALEREQQLLVWPNG